jgi:hypothetical protein
MKYGYKELKEKCKTCLYKCGRVEDINFNGIERCEYYIKEETKDDTNRNTINAKK